MRVTRLTSAARSRGGAFDTTRRLLILESILARGSTRSRRRARARGVSPRASTIVDGAPPGVMPPSTTSTAASAARKVSAVGRLRGRLAGSIRARRRDRRAQRVGQRSRDAMIGHADRDRAGAAVNAAAQSRRGPHRSATAGPARRFAPACSWPASTARRSASTCASDDAMSGTATSACRPLSLNRSRTAGGEAGSTARP